MTGTPYALGRVLEHDERSRGFPAPAATALRSVVHRRYGGALDQGQVGSCTGNALAHALNTVPLRKGRRLLLEADAVALYSDATRLDTWPGSYPPDDTGSSGLAVCRAGVRAGYLTGYDHAFGLDHMLAALVLAPVIVGTDWFDGMFDVDSRGFVHPTGAVAGGHEWCVFGLNVEGRYVLAQQSWGPGWGMPGGRFRVSWDDLSMLLARDGDVTVPKVA